MKRLLLGLFIIIFMGACSKDLYQYYDYDNLIYAYTTGGVKDKEMKKFTKKYYRISCSKKGVKKQPAPGVCVEYGYFLYKQGKKDEAKESFLREVQLYPESQKCVQQILKSLAL
jgi:Uncharacterized protein conserved in bacteria